MPSTQTLTPARRPRRRVSAALVAGGAAVGILLTTGFVSATPALAAATNAPQAGFTLTASPVATATPEAVETIATDAHDALTSARAAVEAAAALASDIRAEGLDLGVEDTSIDTESLRATIAGLSDLDIMPALLLPEATAEAEAETAVVTARVADLAERLEEAREKKAAEEEAARKAAEAKRKAEEAAKALAAGNTVEGAKSTARSLAASKYGWGADQFSCLDSLWTKESGWNYQAYNSSSGATGIPQSLPGSKMATAGADWQTNATTQITWGLGYIAAAYGSPCAAWSHSVATDWY
ncbi:phospholipase [Microbacterium thalassium]|uniref:Phospholipase n=1 Tax=Microbacterium thalassium TaxID=362649 RepID=A0A7X0KW89_9MICO|nr:phospholipase [Microbacterium thalassium]MBB6393031.1 hypothetical protein [Microbacterium thalassium]GLK22738.1 hypothetical protein GCM10017607_00560 [Microbacterium thalassium]